MDLVLLLKSGQKFPINKWLQLLGWLQRETLEMKWGKCCYISGAQFSIKFQYNSVLMLIKVSESAPHQSECTTKLCDAKFFWYPKKFQRSDILLSRLLKLNAIPCPMCWPFLSKLCLSDGPPPGTTSWQVWDWVIIEVTNPVHLILSIHLGSDSPKTDLCQKVKWARSCANHVVCHVANGTSTNNCGNYSIIRCKQEAFVS
jgi:hypothetical protein